MTTNENDLIPAGEFLSDPITRVDVRLESGSMLSYSRSEAQLRQLHKHIGDRLERLEFEKTMTGRLAKCLLDFDGPDVTNEPPRDRAKRRAAKLIADGWNDKREGYPKPERDFKVAPMSPDARPRLTLNGEEIEAIRVLHDSAAHYLAGQPLSPTRRNSTEDAIEILKRFQP